MRLFVSIDIDGLADAVAEIQDLVDADGLRLTDPEQAHVTVTFLGDTDGSRIPDLADELRQAVAESDVRPFEATFGGLGVFPHLDYISVVWLGVREGDHRMNRLHDHVETRTTAMGFDPDDHEFTPHVTLARMDHAGGKGHVQSVVSNRDPTAGTMTVEELRLKESVLTEDGPEYSTVERFPLSDE